jgi:hypothetical protein
MLIKIVENKLEIQEDKEVVHVVDKKWIGITEEEEEVRVIEEKITK